MTIVACLVIGDQPILIADMMISRDNTVTNQPPNFPVLNLNFQEDLQALDVQFAARRKICQISPDLIVGWSGNMVEARRIVRNLRHEFHNCPVSIAALRRHLETVDVTQGEDHDVSLTGWLVSESEPISFCWYSHSRYRIDFGNTPYCIGSSRARDIVQEATLASQSVRASNVQVSEDGLYDGTIIGILGQLYLDVLLDRSSISHRYGYAFEACRYRNRQFSFIDDLEFHFWVCRETLPNDVSMENADSLLRMKYINGTPHFVRFRDLPVMLFFNPPHSGGQVTCDIFRIEDIDHDSPNRSSSLDLMLAINESRFASVYAGLFVSIDSEIPTPFLNFYHWESDKPFTYEIRQNQFQLVYDNEMLIDMFKSYDSRYTEN